MKLFTFKPIAFLLKLSASNLISNKSEDTVISINRNLSFIEVFIVVFESQQKSIGLSIFRDYTHNLLNKISQYILVGKDKSVVTISYLADPTSFIKLI
jgi:hypothetical protein